MGDKGFLTNDQEKQLAKIIDDAIKAKGLLELVDGFAAKALITVIDDAVLNKINLSDALKFNIQALIDAALNEDVEEAQDIASDIINDLVDVPGLDEDTEGLLIKGAVEFVVAAIIKWVQDKE